mgnify:CR=1 FL=1
MEHINKIVIQGTVGTVRLQELCTSKVANFSVATTMVFSNTRDGNVISEITWHNVVAWSGKDMPDLKRITKGTPVHVIGRMRSQKHTSSDGVEKYFYEIMAQKLEILESEQPES